MKTLILASVLILPAFAQDVRQERHEKALKEFQDLHFFYKGRGMSVSPDIIRLYDFMLNRGLGLGDQGPITQRWGLVTINNEFKGINSVPYEGMQVGVLGCVACHSSKAAGVFIPGLGNKNIDVGQIGEDTYNVLKVWGAAPRSNPKFKELHQRSLKFTKGMSDPKLANLTQGLVPTSLVRSWFYSIRGLPLPEDFKLGQVKVPHLWGYGEKRKFGSFWDGEGNGELGGWAIAVELYAGQTPENVKEYYDKVHHAEDLLADFLPPAYPFKVNREKAQKGHELYKASCLGCHGDHQRDLQGHPIYDRPKHIPLRVVKTDSDRLDALTEELYQLIETNPLNNVIQSVRKPEHGYVAPKLWGVWSRFPYLHNASVPTIYDLLTPPEKRPKRFSLKNAGERARFDETKLGLKVSSFDLMKRRRYDTSRPGQSNQGHYFESFKKLTHEMKLDLIEYLKTL